MGERTKRRKNKKIINIISIIIFILLLGVNTLLYYKLFAMSILPLKYMIIALIISILFLTLFGFISIKKNIRNWAKITFDIIAIIIIGICGLGFNYLDSTHNFIKKIQTGNYETEVFYVITSKDSGYTKIGDIKNLATYTSDDNSYQKALKQVNKKVKTKKVNYDYYIDATNALSNNSIDAVLISSNYFGIMEDLDENFSKNTIKLLTIKVKVKKKKVETSTKNLSQDAVNIYISGIDVYGSISTRSRTDANMIMTINPKTHKILLTSIPRDYYVQLHGTTGTKDKLTHSGIYGINTTIGTVQDLLNINIDYYVRVNFTTLIDLVDAIGGIDINSDTSFVAWTNKKCSFKVGTMHLGGECALAYSRERHAYSSGDRHRVQNQQEVIAAIINKIMSPQLITNYNTILNSVSNSIETNIPSDQIYSMVNNQIDSMSAWTFENYSLDGTGQMNITYSTGSQKLYVMIPNQTTVTTAKTKIQKVVDGK